MAPLLSAKSMQYCHNSTMATGRLWRAVFVTLQLGKKSLSVLPFQLFLDSGMTW